MTLEEVDPEVRGPIEASLIPSSLGMFRPASQLIELIPRSRSTPAIRAWRKPEVVSEPVRQLGKADAILPGMLTRGATVPS